MNKYFLLSMLLLIVCCLTSCNCVTNRAECLNLEDFNNFYYNENLYSLPKNYSEIYTNYDFYGEMHQVGYTLGVYNKVFETYVLDTDVEENILFQKDGRYFWFKEGFEFHNLNEYDINKLLIRKIDLEGYIKNEKEFILEDVYINDLLLEYNVDQNTESFLLDDNNFITYRINYIYENGIMLCKFDSVAIYNDKIFVRKYDQTIDNKVYVINENYTSSLYETIMSLS